MRQSRAPEGHPAAGDSGCHTAPGLRESAKPLRGHRPWRSRDRSVLAAAGNGGVGSAGMAFARGCGGPAPVGPWKRSESSGLACVVSSLVYERVNRNGLSES
jgi:hypothetical protein